MLSFVKKIVRLLFLGKEWGGWTEKSSIGAEDSFHLVVSNPSHMNGKTKEHDLEHRALVYLMTQKTDSVLAALAKTIEEERVKLGVAKRVPAGNDSNCTHTWRGSLGEEDPRSLNDRVLSLAQEGATISKIARHLVLPENEVSMVLRLNSMG
jgi:hypothetical protein